MRYHYFLFVLTFVFSSQNHQAQQLLPDSLKTIAKSVSNDSAVKLYVKVASIYTGVNSDSVRKYARIAFELADPKSIARGDVYIQFGNSYHMENKIDSALENYNRAFRHFNLIKNEKGIGKVYQSYGLVKRSMGDLQGAIEDNKKALEIYTKLKWDVGIVNTYNNIAGTYSKLGNMNEALKYARGAFSGSKKLNDSIKYYNMMSEYGGKLAYADKVDSALYYLKQATPFFERNQMYGLLIPAYSNMSSILIGVKHRDLSSARKVLEKAKMYSIQSGAVDNLRFVYTNMFNILMLQNKHDSAVLYFDKSIAFIDSLNSARGIENAREIETKYETEKKELLLQKQSLEIEAQEKEAQLKNRQILFGALALLAIAAFAIFAFLNFIKVKKFNRIINEQKLEVEAQNNKISHQKEQIEEKQKEIIDSITYARRIQQAVLTGTDVWNKISPEHFILFKPKDIVSGDFYWAYNAPGSISVFALADCTGHGVPGGFMSMLGNSFLNEIIVENKIYKADEILNRLRKKIISALEQEGAKEQKDGMDISLCVYNNDLQTIEFAGANNPLLYSGANGLSELKADRMPVGVYAGELIPFKSTSIKIQKGDIIYLTTDGFSDQFGGPKEKKFSMKQLKDVLLNIRSEKMFRQKEILNETIVGWQKNLEQIDDISIIGIVF